MTTSNPSLPQMAKVADPVSCHDVQMALALLPDEPLDEPAKHHLRRCVRCRDEYQTLKASRSALRSLRGEAARPDTGSFRDEAVSLWPEVERSLVRGERSSRRLQPSGRVRMWPIVAASLCVLAATLAWPQQPNGADPQRQRASRAVMLGDPLPGVGDAAAEREDDDVSGEEARRRTLPSLLKP